MSTTLLIIAGVVLGAVLLLDLRRRPRSGPFRGRPAGSSVPDTFAPLAHLFRTHLERAAVGDAALFLFRDDSVIYGEVIGSYRVSAPLPIASATKWLSTAAILTLVDDGSLRLDDPVSWYLPQMSDEKAAITMRQLLACTSGLPSRVPWLKSPKASLEQSVDAIAGVDLVATPGAEFIYGGVGFQVAGRVAEIVTGKPWYRLFRERIRDPLQMHDTSYGIYDRRNGRFYAAQRSNPHIGGGVKTTLQDYANLLQMFLDDGVFEGQRILSPQSVQEMWRDQTGDASIGFTVHWNRNARYGLGGWIDQTDENGVPRIVSSPGAAGWLPWIDRERRYAGILVARCETRKLVRLYSTMTDLIGQVVDATPTIRVAEDAA